MKHVGIGVCVVLCSLILSAGTCGQVDIRAHGTLHFIAATSCWQFEADGGDLYQIVYSPNNILRDGLAGLMEATYSPLTMPSVCGTLINVCAFDGDNTVNLVGTLKYNADLEGGCWALESGSKTYEPWSNEPDFYQDGAKVKVKGIPRDDMATMCMLGSVVEVIGYEFMGPSQAQCQQTRRDCQKVCSANPCLISCDTVYSLCLDSCK